MEEATLLQKVTCMKMHAVGFMKGYDLGDIGILSLHCVPLAYRMPGPRERASACICKKVHVHIRN